MQPNNIKPGYLYAPYKTIITKAIISDENGTRSYWQINRYQRFKLFINKLFYKFKTMKKFKTRKEILTNPELKILLFELLKEEGYGSCCEGKHKIADEVELESRIDFFIDRKMRQCKMEGV